MAKKQQANQKPSKPIDRQYNTALFLLRALQSGLSIGDLKHLTVGMVYDIATESANDRCEYDTLATKSDIDNF